MTLGWLQIIRLGLVQMSLGAIVVLMTSTLNRLMVVELALPAVLPGLLVGLHYGVQITRPNWGFLSDRTGRRTRWIVGGMALLAAGGMLAAAAVPVMETRFAPGLALSVLAYAVIGIGVGASGTSLLALLATATAPRRRPAAATINWLMLWLNVIDVPTGNGTPAFSKKSFTSPRFMLVRPPPIWVNSPPRSSSFSSLSIITSRIEG